MEGGRPTPGLLMVGGVGAGPDSSIDRRGAVSEGARHKLRVGTAGISAPSERLKVVHRLGGPANREDARWQILIVERRLRREGLALYIAVLFRVIFGVGVV